MKGGTVQILWHDYKPIFSVDFHQPTGLLATAGADKDIKLWSLHRQDKSKVLPAATYEASLQQHSAAVNVVRFSPSGELLASGADNGELLIWRPTQTGEEKCSWKVWKPLRYHTKDVLDLGWSPDGTCLVSGSVDNTCIVWNVLSGSAEHILADHQHYVQGVTWDPSGEYLASISGDRTCRIYSLQSPSKRSKGKLKSSKKMCKCQSILSKADASVTSANSDGAVGTDEAPHKQASAKQYLFYDESMPSFFRRLSWSPDGSFLLLPAGVEKESPDASSYSVSYVVSRKDLSRPAIQLPAGSKPVVATRFCPVKYSLRPDKSWKHDTSLPGLGAFRLPYRLIFAVATLNSVYIYDTEQSCPIAVLGGLHFAPVTDLAWSYDAKFLAVSSQDGYCSLVGFDEGDLGTPIPENSNKDNSLPVNSQEGCSQVKFGPNDDTGSSVGDPSDILQKTPPPPNEIFVTGNSSKSQRMSFNRQGILQQIRRADLRPSSQRLHEAKGLKSSRTNLPVLSSGGSSSLPSASMCIQDVTQGNSHVSKLPVAREGSLSCSAIGVKTLAGLQQVPQNSDSGFEEPTVCRPVCSDAQLQPRSTSKEATTDVFIPAESHQLNCWKIDQHLAAECPQGPATPLGSEHVHGVGGNSLTSQKPRDHYGGIHVRPLKFKRILPNSVSEVP